MPHALWIAYYTPPAAGPGAVRVTSFLHHLSTWGWTASVITGHPRLYAMTDPAAGWSSPPLGLVRTGGVDFELVEQKVIAALRGSSARNGRVWVDPDRERPVREASSPCRKWLRRLYRETMGWLHFPDGQVGWLPFAVTAAIREVHRRQPQVMISTSPPHSSQLVGLIVHRLTGIPWVVDLRDPWTLDWPSVGLPRARRAAARRLLSTVLLEAAAVVFNTEEQKQNLMELTPVRGIQRVIPNGYEPAEFDPSPRTGDGALPLLVGHMGHIYPGTSLPFMEAVRQVADDNRKSLAVDLWGAVSWEVEQYVHTHGLEDVVRIRGPVSRRICLERMQACDVLLCLVGDHHTWRSVVPAKLYEYGGAQRFVLGLAPPGACARLIKRAHLGWVVDSTDVRSIAAALRRLAAIKHEGSLPYEPDRSYLVHYQRSRLAGRLADLLGAVAKPQRGMS